jgi:hypothetical protein
LLELAVAMAHKKARQRISYGKILPLRLIPTAAHDVNSPSSCKLARRP